MTRFMNLMTDYAFKRVFGSVENKNVLISFLNVLLAGEKTIVDVNFETKEVLPASGEGKRIVYDVYCTTSDGRHIIVEMQKMNHPLFVSRALFYTGSALIRQGVRGKDWNYKVAPVYGIFIMNFHLTGLAPKLVRETAFEDVDTHEILTDRMKMFFIDLQCLEKNDISECDNSLERWIYSIKNMENMKEKPKGYEDLDKLFDASMMSSLASEDFVEYSKSRQRMLDDREGLLMYGAEQKEIGMKEGIKEGVSQGIKRGLMDVARNMLKLGKGIKEIALVTGLSESEIRALRD